MQLKLSRRVPGANAPGTFFCTTSSQDGEREIQENFGRRGMADRSKNYTVDELLLDYAQHVSLQKEDIEFIRKLIHRAVLEECEACAVVCDKLARNSIDPYHINRGAEEIRARHAISRA